MKDIILGGGACIMVGLGVFFSPPFTFGSTEIIDISKGPVISGTNDEIAEQIFSSPLAGTQQMFRPDGYTTSRPSSDMIAFNRGDPSNGRKCQARILRLDEARAQVVTACTRTNTSEVAPDGFGMNVSNSALVGIMDDKTDTAFREYVHATLEGRPYNESKVKARLAGQTIRNVRALRAETALMNERFSSPEGGLSPAFCEALGRGEFDKSLEVDTLKAECAAQ